MIKDEAIARQVSELMLEFGARLDASVEVFESKLPPDEFRAYRRAIGGVMAEMLMGIMKPIYAEHPALKPAEMN